MNILQIRKAFNKLMYQLKILSQPLAFLVVLLLGILIGVQLESRLAISSSKILSEKQPKKLETVLRLLDAKYINSTDQPQLIQQTLNRLKINKMDTSYIPSKRLHRINEQVDIKPSW